MKLRIATYLIISQLAIIGIIVAGLTHQAKTVVSLTEGMKVNSSLVPNLPTYYEPLPNVRMESELSWLGKEYQYTVINHFNSDTFHQEEEIPIEKGENVFRIITVGDSFTFGAYVNTAENYPSRLQQLLDKECGLSKKIEVINLGVSGYDVEYAVGRFKYRGIKYDPDLVLWLIIPDHLTRINKLISDRAEGFKRQMLSTPEGRRELSMGPYSYLAKARDFIKWEIGEDKIMDYQKKIFESYGLLYARHTIFMSFKDSGFTQSQTELLQEIIRQNKNVTHFDHLRSLKKNESLLPDGHPNRKGHGLIAEDIYNYLISKKLIVCL